MILPIFAIFFLIFSSSHAVQDICVADKSAQGPNGYNCNKPSSVTVKDFMFSGLATPTNSSTLTKSSFTPATVDQLPGLNGLILVSGTVNAGFISGENAVYSANVTAGDVFVYPQGFLHYAVNVGKTPVVGYVGFSSERPGLQVLDLALFGNGLPTDLLTKVSFLDAAQIKKLKGVFGGTY